MSDLQKYFEAQTKVESARNLHNYAGVNLKLAEIRCRYAELRSQHEPLNGFLEEIATSTTISREQLMKIADYVILGKVEK